MRHPGISHIYLSPLEVSVIFKMVWFLLVLISLAGADVLTSSLGSEGLAEYLSQRYNTDSFTVPDAGPPNGFDEALCRQVLGKLSLNCNNAVKKQDQKTTFTVDFSKGTEDQTLMGAQQENSSATFIKRTSKKGQYSRFQLTRTTLKDDPELGPRLELAKGEGGVYVNRGKLINDTMSGVYKILKASSGSSVRKTIVIGGKSWSTSIYASAKAIVKENIEPVQEGDIVASIEINGTTIIKRKYDHGNHTDTFLSESRDWKVVTIRKLASI